MGEGTPFPGDAGGLRPRPPSGRGRPGGCSEGPGPPRSLVLGAVQPGGKRGKHRRPAEGPLSAKARRTPGEF